MDPVDFERRAYEATYDILEALEAQGHKEITPLVVDIARGVGAQIAAWCMAMGEWAREDEDA